MTTDTKILLTKTKGGHAVYVSSETYEHMEAHPDVEINHIIEAIGLITDYNGQFRIGPVDMGRTVGEDHCIEIDANEPKRQYLFRKGRKGVSSVIIDGQAQETSLITIGIAHDDDGKDTLFTAFYGQLAPKEPWDNFRSPEEQEQSEAFWSNHALVCTKESIDWERS